MTLLNVVLLFTAVCILMGVIYDVYIIRRISINKQLNKIKGLGGINFNTQNDEEIPFSERIIKPNLDRIIELISVLLPVNDSTNEVLKDNLLMAGSRISPQRYRAINVIFLFMTFMAVVSFSSLFQINAVSSLYYALIGVLSVFVIRKFSLQSNITKRKKILKSQLPEIMDILSVSVVAGLSFDQSLLHVVNKSNGPLIEEFRIVQQEIQLGQTRKNALKRMSKKLEIEELTGFINAVIQADELGISLYTVLTSQSKMIRNAYRLDVEEAAGKIPIKILIPMVLFIFPVIFLVLLAPAVPRIMSALGN